MSRKAVQAPLFSISFKSYREAVGENAVRLAKIAAEVSSKTSVCPMVVPQVADIYRIAQNVPIAIVAPHVDPVPASGHNGAVVVEAVREAGAIGCMLNHADMKLTLATIRETISRAKEVGLLTMVCVESPQEAQMIAMLHPDIIHAELPSLIGTDSAVSKVDAGFVSDSVRLAKEMYPQVLVTCGAGIRTSEDAAAAIRLGADGVGASRGVVQSENPSRTIKDIVSSIEREWASR